MMGKVNRVVNFFDYVIFYFFKETIGYFMVGKKFLKAFIVLLFAIAKDLQSNI